MKIANAQFWVNDTISKEILQWSCTRLKVKIGTSLSHLRNGKQAIGIENNTYFFPRKWSTRQYFND